MKCSCPKKLLSETISLVEKITGKNLSLPILSSIILEVSGKRMMIRATNLDIGVEIELPVKSDRDGIVAVPASVFSGFLSGISGDGTLEVEEKEGNLTISIQGNNTLIKCLSPEEFPSLPVVDQGTSFSLPVKKLVEGLKSVVYSSSLSDVKPELGSVYMYPEHDMLVFVATDSFRLAEKKIPHKNVNDWGGILIPHKNTLEIIRIFEQLSGDVDIRFNDHQIVFEKEGVYVTSRIIDGSFPDYRQIIPKEYSTTAIVLKKDFTDAFKVSIVFSNTFKQVTMSLNPKEKTYIIETKNTDVGESRVPLQASLSGELITINVNYKYITDSFPSLSGDSVSVSFAGENKPLIIESVGDQSFLSLVMPMNR
ncbi:MAG: DNA polymerase III subunit beta [Parcubacteria group bacterium]|nr:DNA polymerase III subunit beta [Parcubacteria group bacterium]